MYRSRGVSAVKKGEETIFTFTYHYERVLILLRGGPHTQQKRKNFLLKRLAEALNREGKDRRGNSERWGRELTFGLNGKEEVLTVMGRTRKQYCSRKGKHGERKGSIMKNLSTSPDCGEPHAKKSSKVYLRRREGKKKKKLGEISRKRLNMRKGEKKLRPSEECQREAKPSRKGKMTQPGKKRKRGRPKGGRITGKNKNFTLNYQAELHKGSIEQGEAKPRWD